jgi:hypothetical protein
MWHPMGLIDLDALLCLVMMAIPDQERQVADSDFGPVRNGNDDTNVQCERSPSRRQVPTVY